MSDEHDDELLRARLRAADPAASLPAADPTRVARLLEDAMSNDTTERTESRQAGTHGRSPLTWLVAAAAVLLIAGAGAFALVDRGDDPADLPPVASGDPTVTTLTVPAGAAGRCMTPNADTLGGAAYAVDAEVVAVAGGVATLEPSQWYAGDPTDQVEVDAGSADLQALIGAPAFEEGERYLVAGTDDGEVMVCGFSGPWSPDLAALYSDAFGS